MQKARAWWWGFVGLLLHGALQAQSIKFVGRVQNHQSRQFIAATWRWTNAANQLLLERSAPPDGFVGSVPSDARFLTISSHGYRAIRLPVHWPRTPTDSARFLVTLPLVPIDKMVDNQPYFQSEQRAIRLSSRNLGKIAARFLVQDALTGRPIQASICLFFTKAAIKRCFTTASVRTDIFRQDIVAIEASASGYQPYLGNVVIRDSVGRNPLRYVIRLNPTPTLIMMSLPDVLVSVGVLLKRLPNGPIYTATRLTDTQLMANLEPGTYAITGGKKTELILSDTLQLKPGLTAYHLTTQLSSVSVAGEHVIYFNQSSYELTPTAKRQLDQFARIWRTNPPRRIYLSGHTDNVGNAQVNKVLSEFRARTTKTYLVQRGIPEGQFRIESFGSAQPAVSNTTEENRRQNRRVILMVR
ncbi:hypothetical protein GCM10027341_34950 [Spirosoma knui]